MRASQGETAPSEAAPLPRPQELEEAPSRAVANTVAKTLSSHTGEGALVRANARDFRLTDELNIGQGNLLQKARDNFAAIALLKDLEESERQPSDDERGVLARYVGWGAFGQAFQPKFDEYENALKYAALYPDSPHWKRQPELQRAKWSKADEKHYETFKELRESLSSDEFDSARRSILNAHYTHPDIVRAMWEAVRRLGFKGGRVLEPAAGSGNFLGFQPDDLTANSIRTAVELDDLTGRICRYLYPGAHTHITGFQDAPLPDEGFDLAISNVPFGNYGVHDETFNLSGRRGLTSSIHNYFFAKALDKVRPGGVVAFITSHHTLDSQSGAAFREYLRQNADLIGAVRLPNNAFEKNAGTQVTTDIIFLKKHDLSDPAFESDHPRGPDGRFITKPGEADWVSTSPLEVPHGSAGKAPKYGTDAHKTWGHVYPNTATAQVNSYFAQNPHMILGRMGMGSGYGLMSDTDTGATGDA